MNKDRSTNVLDTPPVTHPSWCQPELCDLGDIKSGLGTYGVHTSPMYEFGDDGEVRVWINQTLRFDGQPAADDPEAGICVDGSPRLTPAEAREFAETLTSMADELEPLDVDAYELTLGGVNAALGTNHTVESILTELGIATAAATKADSKRISKYLANLLGGAS